MDSRRKNGSSPKMAITGGRASILTCLSGCCENAIADTSLDAFPAESEVFLAIGNGAGEQETGCAFATAYDKILGSEEGSEKLPVKEAVEKEKGLYEENLAALVNKYIRML